MTKMVILRRFYCFFGHFLAIFNHLGPFRGAIFLNAWEPSWHSFACSPIEHYWWSQAWGFQPEHPHHSTSYPPCHSSGTASFQQSCPSATGEGGQCQHTHQTGWPRRPRGGEHGPATGARRTLNGISWEVGQGGGGNSGALGGQRRPPACHAVRPGGAVLRRLRPVMRLLAWGEEKGKQALLGVLLGGLTTPDGERWSTGPVN